MILLALSQAFFLFIVEASFHCHCGCPEVCGCIQLIDWGVWCSLIVVIDCIVIREMDLFISFASAPSEKLRLRSELYAVIRLNQCHVRARSSIFKKIIGLVEHLTKFAHGWVSSQIVLETCDVPHFLKLYRHVSA